MKSMTKQKDWRIANTPSLRGRGVVVPKWSEALSDSVMSTVVISEKIDYYLGVLGFYRSTMNPVFMNGCVSALDMGVPCLKLNTKYPKDKDYALTIYINRRQAYFEVTTAYSSYEDSGIVKDIDAYLGVSSGAELTVGEVDHVLNWLATAYN